MIIMFVPIVHHWIDYGLFLLVACLAAVNAALYQSQQKQQQQQQRSQKLADVERKASQQTSELLQQVISTYQILLKERDIHIHELVDRLEALKHLHDN